MGWCFSIIKTLKYTRMINLKFCKKLSGTPRGSIGLLPFGSFHRFNIAIVCMPSLLIIFRSCINLIIRYLNYGFKIN